MSVQKAQKGLNYTVKLREAGTESIVWDKLTANTATVFDIFTEKLESSGTAAASLGSGHAFQIENGSGTVKEMGRYDLVMTTATAASEEAAWQFKVITAGTVTKILTVDGTGLTVVGGVSGTTMPTTSAATSAFTSRVTTTDGVASGTARVVGGMAYANVAASAAITSTATEALFDVGQYSIPANTLKAGSVIKFRYQGILTATANTDTWTTAAYIGGLGGTKIFAGTATDATNNDIFSGEGTIVVRTAGASGTAVAVVSGNLVPAATSVASRKDQITASFTINTQAAQVLGISGKWSTTDTLDSGRLDIFIVDIS